MLRPGTMGTRSKKLLIDQVIPTERRVPHSRPDLVVRVEREKRISIMDVACAWDTSIHKRRKEKMDRYVELAADMANQHPGYRVVTVPVVVGDLGTIENLRKDLRKSKLLTEDQITNFMLEAQLETLCGSIRILKSHLATE